MMPDTNSWQRVEYIKICSIFSLYQINSWCNMTHSLSFSYTFSLNNLTVPVRSTLLKILLNRCCRILNWPAVCKFNRPKRLSKQQKHMPQWMSADIYKIDTLWTKIFMHGKYSLAKVLKNLARYRSENNQNNYLKKISNFKQCW